MKALRIASLACPQDTSHAQEQRALGWESHRLHLSSGPTTPCGLEHLFLCALVFFPVKSEEGLSIMRVDSDSGCESTLQAVGVRGVTVFFHVALAETLRWWRGEVVWETPKG